MLYKQRNTILLLSIFTGNDKLWAVNISSINKCILSRKCICGLSNSYEYISLFEDVVIL